MSTPLEHRPSRRTLARGAAWAVPVIAVAAAAPAFAASPVIVSTTATCSVSNGQFVVTVTGLAAGRQVAITLSGPTGSTSSGSATVTGSGSAFILTGTGAATTTGRINVTGPNLTGNGSATVTATVSGVGGVSVAGDLQATITFTRAGNVLTCTGSN